LSTPTKPKKAPATNNLAAASGPRRARGAERAALVQLRFPGLDLDAELEELRLLVQSAGGEIAGELTGRRERPDVATYLGKGKAEELRELVTAGQIDIAIVNHDLSPAQERNLEKIIGCRVLDRTGLILDIFAQRARSHEGKLQVELAQLEHLSTRLVRGWTHLERQRGGIGLRGPGETQLEVDRRLIRDRVKHLIQRLDKVRAQRESRRKARHKIPVPTVSLVGYTNAGKSTLFNRLTGAGVYAADQLFATLDPTMRRLMLTGNTEVILADTVGFIRHLPHDLVEAFKSTLEEVAEADLLLHVVDGASPERHAQIEQVQEVLREIGAEHIPQLTVFNKIDLTDEAPRTERDETGRVTRVFLSARSGAGIELLLEVLAVHFRSARLVCHLTLPPQAGRLRALVYEHLHVAREEHVEQGGWRIETELSEADLAWLMHQDDFLPEMLQTEANPVLARTGS
jgi:GTP-binding protein HflX